MSEELKNCPFCNSAPETGPKKRIMACSNYKCILSGDVFRRRVWNTRPIEDALRAELAEASVYQKVLLDEIAALTSRTEKAEAERAVWRKIAMCYSPCPRWMSFDGRCTPFKDNCSNCPNKFEQLYVCLCEFVAQEAAKRSITPSCQTCIHRLTGAPEVCDHCIYGPDADENDRSMFNYWEPQEAAPGLPA